jgi:hypothetical protein
MVHFTCDLCGKDLTPTRDPRYVVKMAVYAGFDPNEITEDDLDEDHMEAVAEILQREDGVRPEEIEVQQFKGFRFDLCSCCHKKFVKDPLARDLARSLNFSEN